MFCWSSEGFLLDSIASRPQIFTRQLEIPAITSYCSSPGAVAAASTRAAVGGRFPSRGGVALQAFPRARHEEPLVGADGEPVRHPGEKITDGALHSCVKAFEGMVRCHVRLDLRGNGRSVRQYQSALEAFWTFPSQRVKAQVTKDMLVEHFCGHGGFPAALTQYRQQHPALSFDGAILGLFAETCA